MNCLRYVPARAAALAAVLVLGGCTTTSLVLSAAGVATDTSMTWAIVKHLHAKLTEGDPTPCYALDSAERALSPRCGAFIAGSLQVQDLAPTRFNECPLTIAARDARLWPVVPELLAKGARPEACAQAPLVALAQANDCPDLSDTPADVRAAFVTLAETDPRAVQHDVVRWLSCPASRAAGLDGALAAWLAAGQLQPGTLAFSPLGALHPSALASPIAVALEAGGHTAHDALGGYVGLRPSGFEEALRTSDWAALDWWLQREPQLVNRVPPRQGDQLAWLPLARVLVPNFLVQPASRGDMVSFLIARGADPRQHLPTDASLTIAAMARQMKSPLADVLEAATVPRYAEPAMDTRLATSGPRALKLAGGGQ